MKALIKGYIALNSIEIGRAVSMVAGESNQVKAGVGDSEQALGIFDAGYSANEAIGAGAVVPVTLSGLAHGELASSVSCGAFLNCDAEGKLKEAGSGEFVIARALQAGNTGEFVEMVLVQSAQVESGDETLPVSE